MINRITEQPFCQTRVMCSCGYHPTPPRCVSHNASWSDREFYEENNYTEITIEQFKKHILKEDMKTELLGLPIIKGEKHHLEAFVQDCEKFGYILDFNSEKQDQFIRLCYNQLNDILTKARGMDLWWGGGYIKPDYTGNDINIPIKTFNLPQDWSKALDFMKENMDRWNKIQEENKQPEFKVGDYVVILDTGFMFDSSNTRCKDVKQISFMGKHDTIYPSRNIILFTDNSSGQNEYYQYRHYRKATPQEIEEYLNKPKIFKMTSRSGDFELEVSKKGIYYRPEDVFLDATHIENMFRFGEIRNEKSSTRKQASYSFQFETVRVGCKSGCSIQQFQEVYKYYKSLQ